MPVALSAAALAALSKLCNEVDRRAGLWSRLALFLIPVGGMTKPVYKTILAISGGAVDLIVLDDILFWFLAPGFVTLGIGLGRARRTWEGSKPATTTWPAWAAAAVVVGSAASALSGSRSWFFLLLATTTLANIWAIIVLVRWSGQVEDRIAAVLFGASLVIAISLAGAAATLEQTIAVQWGEQLASTASQGLFLWASARLAAKATNPTGRQVSEQAR